MEIARLLDAGAPHDVLALAWMAVLLGDVPPAPRDVLEELSRELMSLMAARDAVLLSVQENRIPRPVAAVAFSHTSHSWGQAHPELTQPLGLLLGFALDDPEVLAVRVCDRRDPEDVSLDVMEIGLETDGSGDDACIRLQERALRAGVLGSLSDDSGGTLVITQVGPRAT